MLNTPHLILSYSRCCYNCVGILREIYPLLLPYSHSVPFLPYPQKLHRAEDKPRSSLSFNGTIMTNGVMWRTGLKTLDTVDSSNGCAIQPEQRSPATESGQAPPGGLAVVCPSHPPSSHPRSPSHSSIGHIWPARLPSWITSSNSTVPRTGQGVNSDAQGNQIALWVPKSRSVWI